MAKNYQLIWEATDSCAVARVLRIRRVGSNTVQQQWPEFPNGDRLCQMIGVHDAKSRELIAEWTDNRSGIKVSHAWIASLSESEAVALDLPASTKLGIDLQSISAPSQSDFHIRRRFKNSAGIESFRTVTGAFLDKGDGLERLPSPLFEIEKAVTPVAKPVEDHLIRIKALETLTHTLGFTGSTITADSFLENLRVFYASGISLTLRVEDGAFDFDPVLFGRSLSEEGSDEGIDEAEDSLLSSAHQEEFLRDFLRRGGALRASALGNGAFVYLDPFVAQAVRVISQKKRAGNHERKSFALNPRRAFKDAFAENGADEEAIDRLFIETDQFSSRVSAIDVWRAPVLPWIKPRPNSWLPEKFGFKIGDKKIVVSPEQATALADAIQQASDRGDEFVEFNNEQIPVTSRSLEAAQDIAALADAISENIPENNSREPSADTAEIIKKFLIVDENFEIVTYQPQSDIVERLDLETKSPTNLRSTFKTHQVVGFNWLVSARCYENRGALLADDMGLGKTLQSLAFISWRKEQAKKGRLSSKPTLIVAPTALQDNWIKEMSLHFAPKAFADVQKVTGTFLKSIRTGSRDVDTGVGSLDTAKLREFDVLITTYETMRDYHLSFARIAFDTVIFDEIQKLKNPTSQVTRTAKTLNAEFVLALTGTPVENRLQDVWSIMDVTWPGKLGSSKEFATKYNEASEKNLRELNDVMTKRDNKRPELMMRRMKAGTMDGLPEKTVKRLESTMPADQANIYTDILRRVRSESGRGGMLKALQGWRSVSVHPEKAPRFDSNAIDQVIEKSARFKIAFDVLKDVHAKGEKALIFLEHRDWQGWLANAIRCQFDMIDNPSIINGAVPGGKRQEIVDQFQNSPAGFNAMILSPKAAGIGLTITAANHVIHLSRWWNPAVEDQATDRVYRIGQDKPVTVYIPQAVHPNSAITLSSFDLKLDELMERKRKLSGDFLAPAEVGNEELSTFYDDLTAVGLDENLEDESQPSKNGAVSAQHTIKDKKVEPAEDDPLPDGHRIHIKALAAGEKRPIEAALEILTHGRLVELWIEDPYFACENVLNPVSDFIRNEIFERFGFPEKTLLHSFDPDHPKIRNRMNGMGKGAVKQKICERVGMAIQFNFEGPRNKYFHDRSMVFVLNTDYGMKNIRWNLPAGLEHWLDENRPQQETTQICESKAQWCYLRS